MDNEAVEWLRQLMIKPKSKIIFEKSKSNIVTQNNIDYEITQTTYVLDVQDGMVTVDKVEYLDVDKNQPLFTYNIFQHCVLIKTYKELNLECIVDRLEKADPTLGDATDFEFIRYKQTL